MGTLAPPGGPIKTLLLQLTQHLLELGLGLFQALLGSRHTEADPLHRMEATAAAARQGPPQTQPFPATFKPQADSRGSQKAIVLSKRPIDRAIWVVRACRVHAPCAIHPPWRAPGLVRTRPDPIDAHPNALVPSRQRYALCLCVPWNLAWPKLACCC